MRKLLNTLYITTPESYISKEGENVVVLIDKKEHFRVPVLNIESIVTMGYMGASPGVMKLCAERGIALTFLSPQGRFISRVQGQTKGNVLLRVRQYALAQDTDFALHISQICIAGKIQNYRNIVRRFVRDYGDSPVLKTLAEHLQRCKQRLFTTLNLDEVRGIEGDAASQYFSAFSHLIVQQQSYFKFSGRSRRPPKDAINVMLSFVYTLIANDVSSALETVGLDPYVGFLHALRPGRTSLALDLMEELRAYLGDRLVLSLINRRQISPQDFINQTEDSIVMTDQGRKIMIAAWQNRKKELITHPFLKERIPIGLLPYVQAQLLARYMRGELDDYPVFIIT